MRTLCFSRTFAHVHSHKLLLDICPTHKGAVWTVLSKTLGGMGLQVTPGCAPSGTWAQCSHDIWFAAIKCLHSKIIVAQI